MLEEAIKIKRFEDSTLGSVIKKLTDIAKGQYNFFKDQINIVNSNREDSVKAEDDEIIDISHYRYTSVNKKI